MAGDRGWASTNGHRLPASYGQQPAMQTFINLLRPRAEQIYAPASVPDLAWDQWEKRSTNEHSASYRFYHAFLHPLLCSYISTIASRWQLPVAV